MRHHDAVPSAPVSAENRTTFLGVNSAEAESDEVVLSVVTDGELFRIGSNSRDMPYCSRDANVLDDFTDLDAEVLRFDRGVDGPPVEVRVDSDAYESVGVRGTDRERDDWSDVSFLSEERAGGGGSCKTEGGAESLLRCVGRLGLDGDETLREGVSSMSRWRARALYTLEEPRCGVRDMCSPIAICSIVGFARGWS